MLIKAIAIVFAIITTKVCGEYMILYEDFELLEEDRDDEILLIKNRLFLPQNCEDLMEVLNVTDGWYHVKSEPKDLNVYCKSRLLNEKCPPTLYCNSTYGLTCNQTSHTCQTKPGGNLLGEKCLNDSYCSTKYLLHCDEDTKTCKTKRPEGNLKSEPCLRDSYCDETYVLTCDLNDQTCKTRVGGNLLGEKCIDDLYCNVDYLLDCDDGTKTCKTTRREGNLKSEPCLRDSYCDETYVLTCDLNDQTCKTRVGGNLLGEKCIDDLYCNVDYLLDCDDGTKTCKTTRREGNLKSKPCFNTSYCDTHFRLKCADYQCVLEQGGNLLSDNCIDNSYCNEDYLLTCVSDKCKTKEGNGQNELGEPCAHSGYCGQSDDIYCDNICRQGGQYDSVCSTNQDCNNRRNLKCFEGKCQCNYTIEYGSNNCIPCPEGFSSMKGFIKCYEIEKQNHMNYSAAFNYCRSKGSTLSILRSDQDKNNYKSFFGLGTDIWVNYYKADNKLHWGDDSEIDSSLLESMHHLTGDDKILTAKTLTLSNYVRFDYKSSNEKLPFRCEYNKGYTEKLNKRETNN